MDIYFQKPKEDSGISGFPKPRFKLFVRHIFSLFGVYRFCMPPRRAELSYTSSILPRFLFDFGTPLEKKYVLFSKEYC